MLHSYQYIPEEVGHAHTSPYKNWHRGSSVGQSKYLDGTLHKLQDGICVGFTVTMLLF